jgi:hypothetical protein
MSLAMMLNSATGKSHDIANNENAMARWAR